ncbi:conjugal transfer protein TraD [Sphingomonas sp.]|uniref:conjugal transfer protein TraD n=1 Tax=Sphingomonas sp. TaxID=28214 RepID=UPI003D6C9582
MARRERTRHLIELGGLVQKAELVGIADDDRALLYGAFLALALQMQGEDAAEVKLLFRRRGARAFATEAEEAAATPAQGKSPRTPNMDARPKDEA